MVIENFKNEIISYLRTTDEIWIAVALIKDNTWEFIQGAIAENTIQHHLVGIDLPTQPSVLRSMQSKQKKGSFECAIYKSKFNFHPKVYLIKANDKYTAFVGSSNLTEGGFENNVELNYKITDQRDCLAILDWFNSLFKDGYPLTDENLLEYEKQLESVKEIEEQLNKRRKSIILKKTNSGFSPLDGINFSDRYFKYEHHWAFRRELWYSDSAEAITERKLAKERCIELHVSIFRQFKEYGVQILEPNPMPDHLISMIRQIDPIKPRAIDAIWLSYGKSDTEIKLYQKIVGQDQKAKQTFIHHARLQIRIDLKNIGIWLLFGKENEGGIFDRDFFKGNMRNKEYRDKFFEMAKTLPDDYFIAVGGKTEYLFKFTSPEELHDFCKKDDLKKYFIIGKDYDITDDEMSEKNLPGETLKVFKLLFPFYQIMRHRAI